jgi:hypothetical protein
LDTDPDFTSPLVYKVDEDTTFQVPALDRGQTYFWQVHAQNLSGDIVSSDTKAFYVSPTAGVQDIPTSMPEQVTLVPAYPNPFNNVTRVNFGLAKTSHVLLCLYDIQGRLVATLADKSFSAGQHDIQWHAEGNSSGLYFCRITVGNISKTGRLLLQK